MLLCNAVRTPGEFPHSLSSADSFKPELTNSQAWGVGLPFCPRIFLSKRGREKFLFQFSAIFQATAAQNTHLLEDRSNGFMVLKASALLDTEVWAEKGEGREVLVRADNMPWLPAVRHV